MVRFWFWNRTKNSNLQMNVFNSHRGNISALFKIKKRLLGKDLKRSALFPIHCRLTVLSQQPISFCLLPSSLFLVVQFIFWFSWFHCGAIVPTWLTTKEYLGLLLNTNIYRPLVLCIHTSVCQTKEHFAQKTHHWLTAPILFANHFLMTKVLW